MASSNLPQSWAARGSRRIQSDDAGPSGASSAGPERNAYSDRERSILSPRDCDWPEVAGTSRSIYDARQVAIDFGYSKEETDRAIDNLRRNRGEHQTQMY